MEIQLLKASNLENQESMAAYMKNKFSFLGITAPERQKMTQPIIRASKELTNQELLDIIAAYYQMNEREYQYLAIDIATKNVNRMSIEEVLWCSQWVSDKAWWDSVDAWRKYFGLRIKKRPEELAAIFHYFYSSKNFWQRRVAINLQLHQKQLTKIELLKKAIQQDIATPEFFIQKAIGWSLREYSKTNPIWVTDFIANYPLSKLATREGLKHIGKLQ